MPKALLIIPPCFTNPELDFEVGFPVNLLLLGRQIRMASSDVLYLDMTLEEKEGCDSFNVLNVLLNDHSIKLVGISNHTVRTSTTTRRVAEHIKSLRPDVKLVVGGVNATFMWRQLLEWCPAIDYILRGYAQTGIRALLASDCVPEPRVIPGLVMRHDGRIHVEPSSSITPEDFNILEFDTLDVPRYLNWTKTYPLLTHTGCGFACNFCTSVMPGPYQNREVYRPVEQVIGEMRRACAAGFDRFFMTANIFTSNRAYCLEFCEALRKESLISQANWSCMTRVEFVDAELLGSMREAGCENIAFGVETAGREQWRSLRKGRFSEETVFDAFRITSQAGIETTAYLMLGAPEQTQDDIEATIELIIDIDPAYRVISFFQPFPGTPYWENPEAFGLEEIAPMEDWNFHEAPICRTRYLDKQALFEAAVRFYLCRANQPSVNPAADALELTAGAGLVCEDMPPAARDAFAGLGGGFVSLEELLERVRERHGTRGRLIALYWLSAALRDGWLRVVTGGRVRRGEGALVEC